MKNNTRRTKAFILELGKDINLNIIRCRRRDNKI